MKGFLTCIALLVFFGYGYAQTKLPGIDKSPMDISFYPVNYPLLKIQEKITEPLLARVIFSRPQKNGRTIFGELIEYGKVWRLGANEASEIEFYQNVKINNVRVKKGRYTLYAIPEITKWIIILNRETDTWGSFKYDEKKDIVRMELPVIKQTEIAESFVMIFEKSTNGFQLIMAWDDTMVSLPVTL